MGWIGVDLDGTLAYYEHGQGDDIGKPIPAMLERVKRWISEGKEVRIMTARATHGPVYHVQDWAEKHTGVRLRVTASKDYSMEELWDDRAIQVIPNTGRTLADEHEAELQALKGEGPRP